MLYGVFLMVFVCLFLINYLDGFLVFMVFLAVFDDVLW